MRAQTFFSMHWGETGFASYCIFVAKVKLPESVASVAGLIWIPTYDGWTLVNAENKFRSRVLAAQN